VFKKIKTWRFRDLLVLFLSCCFVLFIQGAIPFLAVPTLGQAIWSMGWAESFSQGSLFDLYAHDFGIPEPAPIAFGLAGAWPASLFIRLGLHPGDAYSVMVGAWTLLAMFSAYRIARLCGSGRPVSLISAIVWMSMPIVWAHAGYSMLGLGIALLPFYFLAVFRLFLLAPGALRIAPSSIALYFVATLVSVFMDGYTFMMFATGGSIFLVHSMISRPELRRILMRVAVPVHIASFVIAYVLFSAYIGMATFEAHDIEFFRAWGLDLSFLVAPTTGLLSLPDALGWSVLRTDKQYFGDESVWVTTFALPMIAAAMVAAWRLRKTRQFPSAVLLVAAFGFYMALGPSLKINLIKPAVSSATAQQTGQMIPPGTSLIPTGNSVISEYLPGFKVMRASYRWSALGIFALWLVIVCRVGVDDGEDRRPWIIALTLIIIVNLPHLRAHWHEVTDNRIMLLKIDHDLVTPLRGQVSHGRTAMFIPWQNDFFANYLAPRSGFRTLNIGGDKNLGIAQRHWPSDMMAFGEIDASKAPAASKMLVDGTADVLIVPYFNTLWSAHLWPCPGTSIARMTDARNASYQNIPGFVCPSQRKHDMEPVIRAFQDVSFVQVEDLELFAVVKLRPEYLTGEKRRALNASIYGKIEYPLTIESSSKQPTYFLKSGWHALEADHVWSTGSATLRLPVPEACMKTACELALKFGVFGAGSTRPVSVLLSIKDNVQKWSRKVVVSTADAVQVRVPLTARASGLQDIDIAVPDAVSPLALNGSADGRVLGISLQRIDLLTK
jgi:hypothetical protein